MKQQRNYLKLIHYYNIGKYGLKTQMVGPDQEQIYLGEYPKQEIQYRRGRRLQQSNKVHSLPKCCHLEQFNWKKDHP